jgi:hypothetical protein
MNLKYFTTFSMLFLFSCEEKENFSVAYNRIIVNNIAVKNGYFQFFEPQPSDLQNYYEDLFKLFLLNKKSFFSIKSLLNEKGLKLKGDRNISFKKIVDSPSYSIDFTQTAEKNYSEVTFKLKQKMVSRFLIDNANIKYLSDLKNHDEIFTNFWSALESDSKF